MTLRFRCECGQKLRCPDDKLGKRAKCPKCANWVRIPESSTYDTIAEKTQPQKQKEALSETGTALKDKVRILVADSSEPDRTPLVVILQQHGYWVFEASDGPQAIDLIRKHKPHCAVLDVKLDILSGFQVIEQIQNMNNAKNDAVWNTPVIMTTAKLRGRDKQYSMSLGAKGYFLKPVTPAQICPKIEKEMARHEAGI